MTGTPDLNQYQQLLLKFSPQTIKSEQGLAAAQDIIDSLVDKRSLSQEERDFLSLLGTLVSEYERKHHPIPDIYGVELLKVLIEEHGLRQKDLLPIFKTESIISDVLSGKRKLTIGHVQGLAKFFHVSPNVFFEGESNVLLESEPSSDLMNC